MKMLRINRFYNRYNFLVNPVNFHFNSTNRYDNDGTLFKVLDKNMMCTTDLLDTTKYNFGLNILQSIRKDSFLKKYDLVIKPESDSVYETNTVKNEKELLYSIYLTKKYSLDNIQTYFYFNKDVISAHIAKVKSNIVNRSTESILDLSASVKKNILIWNNFIKKTINDKNFMIFVTKNNLHIPKFYLTPCLRNINCFANKHLIETSPVVGSVVTSNNNSYTISTVENIDLNCRDIYAIQIYPETVPDCFIHNTEFEGIYETNAVKIKEMCNFNFDITQHDNIDYLHNFTANNSLSNIVTLLGDITSIKNEDVDKYKNLIKYVLNNFKSVNLLQGEVNEDIMLRSLNDKLQLLALNSNNYRFMKYLILLIIIISYSCYSYDIITITIIFWLIWCLI